MNKKILLIILCLILIIGIFFTFYFLKKDKNTDTDSKEIKEETSEEFYDRTKDDPSYYENGVMGIGN